jgi:ribosome-binding ATPase YchF (GTP1/OBG family)
VVRCFEDEQVAHCEECIDPLRDIKTINDELRLKDKEMIAKKIEKYKKRAEGKERG